LDKKLWFAKWKKIDIKREMLLRAQNLASIVASKGATDFSIAAIMARGPSSREPSERSLSKLKYANLCFDSWSTFLTQKIWVFIFILFLVLSWTISIRILLIFHTNTYKSVYLVYIAIIELFIWVSIIFCYVLFYVTENYRERSSTILCIDEI
jgi:hypothetical protein